MVFFDKLYKKCIIRTISSPDTIKMITEYTHRNIGWTTKIKKITPRKILSDRTQLDDDIGDIFYNGEYWLNLNCFDKA